MKLNDRPYRAISGRRSGNNVGQVWYVQVVSYLLSNFGYQFMQQPRPGIYSIDGRYVLRRIPIVPISVIHFRRSSANISEDV